MNAQEAQTLQLHEMVVWTPDGMRGEVIVKDGSGVKIRTEFRDAVGLFDEIRQLCTSRLDQTYGAFGKDYPTFAKFDVESFTQGYEVLDFRPIQWQDGFQPTFGTR
jgi:hypothetical protein